MKTSKNAKRNLMYMEDIKLLATNEKESETLTGTVRIYSQHIGIEFGWEKCAMVVMKSGKRHMTEGIELPNQEKVRTLGKKETYKYLGILEADSIKLVEIKKNLKSISVESESYSRQNDIAGTLSKL